MKKMKFTLGLALSMIILGASVANAQFDTGYEYSDKKDGGVTITSSLKGCNYFAEDVIIEAVYILPDVDYIDPAVAVTDTFPVYTFLRPGINKDDTVINLPAPGVTAHIWNYGEYTWIRANNHYTWNYGLLFLQKLYAKAYVQIVVKIAYAGGGNDLRPVVKRHATLGGGIQPNPPSALTEASRRFHPYEDRGDGIATFVFQDDLIGLLDKHPISALHYEISANDEYGTPGDNYYNPPTAGDPIMQYAIQLLPEEGIKTDPVTYEGRPIYVQGQKDFTFTVFSPSEPKVTTDPVRRDNWKQVIEPIIKDNNNGSYAVTLQYVNKPLIVSIAVVNDTESGPTANLTLLNDALWAASGTLHVQATKPSILSIYTVTGQLFKQMPVNGNFTVNLPKGLYIVQLNGKSYKIIN